MAWINLLIAALFEVGFTTALKLTEAKVPWAYALFVACAVASFAFLQAAIKAVPIGIAYAVWTGLGAAGTLIVSLLAFGEPINRIQVAFVCLLIISVAGIKLAASTN